MRFCQPDNLSKALVALLVVTAVATVLITPDPTDDIHAVMRAHKTLHAPAAALSLGSLLALLVAENLRGGNAPGFTWSNSLRLLCTCRC